LSSTEGLATGSAVEPDYWDQGKNRTRRVSRAPPFVRLAAQVAAIRGRARLIQFPVLLPPERERPLSIKAPGQRGSPCREPLGVQHPLADRPLAQAFSTTRRVRALLSLALGSSPGAAVPCAAHHPPRGGRRAGGGTPFATPPAYLEKLPATRAKSRNRWRGPSPPCANAGVPSASRAHFKNRGTRSSTTRSGWPSSTSGRQIGSGVLIETPRTGNASTAPSSAATSGRADFPAATSRAGPGPVQVPSMDVRPSTTYQPLRGADLERCSTQKPDRAIDPRSAGAISASSSGACSRGGATTLHVLQWHGSSSH